MIHYYATLVLVIINGLFVGRAIYLVKSNQSPHHLDYLLRRYSSYSYIFALISLTTYPLSSSRAVTHLAIFILPTLIPLLFFFLPQVKRRYPLLHPLLHYLIIIISLFYL